MKVLEKKTVRFSQLASSFGKPYLKTLWTAPEEDQDLSKAVKANRVVTLKQTNVGTKKDFGIIGFFPDKTASYLIFPKELAYAEGTKVIGVKYDLLGHEQPKDPIDLKKRKKSNPEKQRGKKASPIFPQESKAEERFNSDLEAKKPSQQLKQQFNVELRIIAEQTMEFPVEAGSRAAAKKQASENHPPFDPSKAKFSRKLLKVSQVS